MKLGCVHLNHRIIACNHLPPQPSDFLTSVHRFQHFSGPAPCPRISYRQLSTETDVHIPSPNKANKNINNGRDISNQG